MGIPGPAKLQQLLLVFPNAVDAASVAPCECPRRMTKTESAVALATLFKNQFSERERRWAHSKRDATCPPVSERETFHDYRRVVS